MVSIDAEAERRCPLEVDLKPGTHELVAKLDGYAQLRTEVIVQPAQPRTVRLTLVPAGATARPFPVLGVTLLGGGVVAGGLGTLFAVLAGGAARDVTALSSTGGAWAAKAVALQSSGQLDNVLGWTLIGLGTAAVVAGVVVLVLPAPTPTEHARLKLSAGPSGVFACGTF